MSASTMTPPVAHIGDFRFRVLDVFCGGAGGWSLGLHRTGCFETVAACEIDDLRRAMFAFNFPSARMYGDIRQLTASRLRADRVGRVDILVGSPPCQDASAANEQSSSLSLSDLLKKPDPVGRVLRTALSSWVAEASVCLVDWRPRVSRSGRLFFRLKTLALRTSEKDYSLSVATPTRSDVKRGGAAHFAHSKNRGRLPSAANIIGHEQRLKVATPRKNKRGFSDSHGVPFETTELGQAIIAALGDVTGSRALAPTHEALMGYPPGWLAAPLKHMATQSSPKRPKRLDAPSSPPRSTRVSASKRIVAGRKLSESVMSKLVEFARGGVDSFTEAERKALVSAGLAFIHPQPEPRLILTEAGWAVITGEPVKQEKGRSR